MGYAMRASLGSRIKSRGLWAWRRASARYPKLAAARRRLAVASVGPGREPVAAPEEAADGLSPANIVWIFCVARSGSTWLASMMGEMGGTAVWKEPRVGHLFGEFYENNPKAKTASANFIMGTPTRPAWICSIRHFVLTGARYAFPNLGPDDFLVVKEPGGGVGAPFLMEALPESRMILLVRDPRDVVASSLDATRKESWQRWGGDAGRRSLSDERPEAVARRSAKKYLRNMENARRAFGAHTGPKAVVLYEELRADTLGTMRRLYSDLGIEVDGRELARAPHPKTGEDRRGDHGPRDGRVLRPGGQVATSSLRVRYHTAHA